jgi:drug/metabolite transporter (DMT)-like permease
MTLLFAAGTFAARYVPFRRMLRQLRREGRITVEKPAVKETGLVRGLMIVGILLLVLLPFFSVRFADPLIWMSALFGYIIGMNAGELSYYLYVRNLEASMSRRIYRFDFEDPITSKRITGYRLEKITD